MIFIISFLKGRSEFQKGTDSQKEGISKKAKGKEKIQITQSNKVKGKKIKALFQAIFERGNNFFQEEKNKKGNIQSHFKKRKTFLWAASTPQKNF